jgi:subtilase family serine protease
VKLPLLAASLVALELISAQATAAPMTGIAVVGDSDRVTFDMVLPLRDPAGLESIVARQHDPASPLFHHWLTPAQVAERFGPTAASLNVVMAALNHRGLSVVANGRLLRVTGTAAQANALLHTTFAIGRSESGHQHLFATTTPTLPGEINAVGVAIVGLGRDPHEAHTMMKRVDVPASTLTNPASRAGTTGGYWYDDLKQAYQYPSYRTMVTKNGQKVRLDGTGTTIGILMSSDIFDADVELIFNHENFIANSGQNRNPSLYARVAVDGGAGTDTEALGEASLDVQQALGGAPGSHVILYEIPSLADSTIVDGYFQIIMDNAVDIVSSSFGGCELAYTAAYNDGVDFTQELDIEHQLYLQGNAQGMSFLASSGDNAGLECPNRGYVVDGKPGKFVASVSVPAADPNVTAVGGTNLITIYRPDTLDSAYYAENAFADPLVRIDPYGLGVTVGGGYWGAGGGVSKIYSRPSYQGSAGINTGSTTHRALPDIGMQVGGCPAGEAKRPCNGGDLPKNGNGNNKRSYVFIAVDGAFSGAIGTSVASPELASAVALLVEQYGRMGNLNPYIYSLAQAQTAAASNSPTLASTAFHRAIPGFDGVVTNGQPGNTSGAYFNYTVGNGTPRVFRFVGAASAAPAGAPQSPSNP